MRDSTCSTSRNQLLLLYCKSILWYTTCSIITTGVISRVIELGLATEPEPAIIMLSFNLSLAMVYFHNTEKKRRERQEAEPALEENPNIALAEAAAEGRLDARSVGDAISVLRLVKIQSFLYFVSSRERL